MTHTQSVETLLPCPLCNNEMEIAGQLFRHKGETQCLLHDLGWPIERLPDWNTRLQSIPEPLSDERLVERLAKAILTLEGVMNNPKARTALEPELYTEILALTASCGRDVVLELALNSIPRPEAGRVTEVQWALEYLRADGWDEDAAYANRKVADLIEAMSSTSAPDGEGPA